MKRIVAAVSLIAWLSVPWPAAAAEKSVVVELWPGKAPDETGKIGPEIVRMSPKLTRKEVEVTEPTRLVTNVTKPTLTVYRPAKDRDTGTAILICPGGGYWNLYWELEGEEVAAWLTAQGVTGILLKYRVPRRPDEPKGEPARRPLQDAQRAVSLVRSKAKEWGLDPRRIGMVGFSAGGHLAIATATRFEKRTYQPIDDVDKVSCRPDFAIAAYPGYLKAREKDELSPGLSVPAQTPPIFLAHGGADIISTPEHSVFMYLALKRAGIPAELHLYAGAAHDFGVRKVDHPCATWTDRCLDWLRSQGFLKKAGSLRRQSPERPVPRPGPAPAALRHVMVYHKPGRFAGWPANHGIWSWGEEILVGFSAGTYKDLGPGRHAIDRGQPEEHLLARSRDGGLTWTVEDPSRGGVLVPAGKMLHGVPPPGLKQKPWRDCAGGMDFTHPDFALTVRMTDAHAGPSWFACSTDRGRSWDGPFRLPLFGQRGIAARTDYVIDGKRDCTLFLTAAKPDGREGRPLCVRTTDGGRTWALVGWIGAEPAGYAIMPATVRLGARELLTAVRRRDGPRAWIETYRSLDDGQSWKLDTLPAPDLGTGNPASLIRLADGRLCLTYGRRAAPYSIRARLSGDGGRTWSAEVVLRDGGGGEDLGYPRSVQRADGKVVTVYYFWDRQTGPERYVAATVWDPGRAPKIVP